MFLFAMVISGGLAAIPPVRSESFYRE